MPKQPKNGGVNKPSKKGGKKMKPPGYRGGSTDNRSIGAVTSSRRPRVFMESAPSPMGKTVIRGCELLAEVQTSQYFNPVVRQYINPGNFILFPRLSSVSFAFEKFRFRKLRFRYIRGCPSSTQGSMMSFIDYDAEDSPAPSALQAMANETSVVGSVWEDHEISFNCQKDPGKEYFVTSNLVSQAGNGVVSAGELRQNYPGIINVYADKGSASPGPFAGYVYAEYEVELLTLKPPTPVSCTSQATTSSLTTIGKVTGTIVGLPLQQIDSQAGVMPRIEGNTDATYNSKGGVAGAVDAAKAIYEAGTWLYDAYATYSTASIDATAICGASVSSDYDQCDDKKASIEGVLSCAKVVRLRGAALEASRNGGIVLPDGTRFAGPEGSGDVVLNALVYDVTPPNVIDPDFPISNTNMTAATSANLSESTLGSTSGTSGYLSGTIVVPFGRQYMIQPQFGTGITTGRTLASYIQCVSAMSEAGI